MQPSTPRRVHSLKLKTAFLAECGQPGAAVSGVALSRGLNADLVEKWLDGRGLKRAVPAHSGSQPPRKRSAAASSATSPMRFVPVVLAVTDAEVMLPGPASNVRADIPVELRRGNAQLAVCRPSSQSEHCAAWLIALARAVLK